MKIFSTKFKKELYLDYAAATPIDRDILKFMRSKEEKLFANPSSLYSSGVMTSSVIADSRKKIADCIFAHSDEIIFAGSGTESNALAILGIVRAYTGEDKPHIITSVIEHSAVLENCKMLERNGQADVTYVSINKFGFVDIKEIKSSLRENTILVSIMYANNEIGTIQPITEIAKAIRHFRKIKKLGKESYFEKSSDLLAGEARHLQNSFFYPVFHTDACQAMNYLPIKNIEKLGVDLLTFNSSKIYGPKGVGVLYKKRGVIIEPIYYGGGQEFGIRSGTENTIAIIGIAQALVKACFIKEKEINRLIKIRDYGIEKLLALSKIADYKIILNGDREDRLPNNINISISGISSELLVIELDARGIFVSSKSACKSDEIDESYVISALRLAQDIKLNTIDGSLRISLGRQTKKTDMDILVLAIADILKKYKKWK